MVQIDVFYMVSFLDNYGMLCRWNLEKGTSLLNNRLFYVFLNKIYEINHKIWYL